MRSVTIEAPKKALVSSLVSHLLIYDLLISTFLYRNKLMYVDMLNIDRDWVYMNLHEQDILLNTSMIRIHFQLRWLIGAPINK